MKKSIVIGLTGQTGAGKSTVCRIASEYGAGIVNADIVAREVMAKGSKCLSVLAEAFGSDIIGENGELVRQLLAERAFSCRENTELLNSITHPIIIERAKEHIERLTRDGAEIILFDAPQLFESGGDSLCDLTAAVTAPEDIRLGRIIKRDGISEQAARLRMNAQHDEDFFRSSCDIIIDGSKSFYSVRRTVKKLLDRLRAEIQQG